MRIALITDGIWPYVIGGMQKHSYYMCKYLAQQKVEVDLYHFNASTYDISKLDFFTEEEKKYIRSIVVPFPKSFPFPGHYLYNSFKHSQLIFKEIEAKLSSYDFIYSKGFTAWSLILKKSKNEITCPPIGIKFHGYEMFQKPPNFKIRLQHIFLLRKPVRELSQKADVVFSYGGKITDIIRSIGVKPERIIELPSGVEENILQDTIHPTGNKIKFLFLGRYERRKGIEELNQAIQLLANENKMKNIEFHFIGPIPELKRIKFDSVFYHGEIRDKLILNQAIRSCDILLCPSWSEGMPNVILEAMANGLAVVATDVGATNVLVNENNGWLLKESNVDEIKNIIEKISSADKKDIDLKKQKAIEHIKQSYTWNKLIQRFLKALPVKG